MPDSATNTPETTLPDGYTMRPTVPEDDEAIARIITQSARLRGEQETVTVDDVRSDWRHPNFVLAKASRVVFDRDNQLIGFILVRRDMDPNPVHPFIGWAVLPVPDRQQIALVLFQWANERAHHVIEHCPPNARIAWRVGTLAGYKPDETLFNTLQLTPVYYFSRMLITMKSAPEVRPLPDGISLKIYQHPGDLPRLVTALEDAWRDHFGYIERPIEEAIAEWQRHIEVDTLFEAAMWFLAIDDASGEIAGMVLARSVEPNDPDAGYVETVATRRPWRGRGIAQALLLHAFGEFWRRSKVSVVLYVDNNSPTGANRLYERVGMHVQHQYVQYEREIRPGIELSNT